MRWFSFAILTFVFLILQVSLARLFGVGPQHIMPDLFLLLAVVIAFRGPAEHAPITGWILGLLKDLTSDAPLGAYTLTFGLLAWLIVRIRDIFYGEHPLTLIFITFIGSFLVETLVVWISVFKKVISGERTGDLWVVIFFSALLTAAVAPYVQWIIMKFHRQLGIPRRRTYGQSL